MPQTFFYTRFGIGVADPQWWQYRLRLFQSVTFPSIERHLSPTTEWVIAVDASMDRAYREWLAQIIESTSKSRHIRVEPVTVLSEAPYRLHLVAIAHREVRIVRIDDDDAIASNYFDLIPASPGLHTLPLGYEAAIAERVMRVARRPFLSLNTVFHGDSALTEDFSRMGHHRMKEWADLQGLPVTEVNTPHKAYIYARHKQSDSTFGAVRSSINKDPKKETLTRFARDNFGFDEHLFEEWRQHAAGAPSTGGEKTWSRSHELNNEASAHVRALRKISSQIRDSTANLFG